MYTVAFDIIESEIDNANLMIEDLDLVGEVKFDDHFDNYYVEIKTVMPDDLEKIYNSSFVQETLADTDYSTFLELFVEGL